MKYLVHFLTFILLISVTTSQEIPDVLLLNSDGKLSQQDSHEPLCSHGSVTPKLAQRASSIKKKPFDVLNYNLYMDWRKPLSDTGSASRRYTGVNIITMRIDSDNVQKILLEAGTLRIDSVFLDGQKLTSSATKKSDSLTIALPKIFNTGDTIAIALHYTHTSTQNSNYFGFVCYPKGTFVQNDTVQETIAYTNSEPQGARLWMPCNDQPDDKATTVVTITVPNGFRTASNGIQSDKVEFGTDASFTYTWNGDKPIPTYLMHIAASKYQIKREWYKRRNNPNDSIEVPLYYWKKDEQIYPEGFNWVLPATVTMLETYSDAFGEYPFAKYGQDLLFPYFYGAMEHQTITSHHRNAVILKWENVICHELMHHWTGDKVTCATWGDIWLNEGGATFGEYYWVEKTQGTEEARKYRAERRDKSYFRSDEAASQPAIYGVPLSNLFNGGTTYIKGGWVYHMLRDLVGDSLFFPTLRTYFDTFAYKSAETEDMIAVFEKNIHNPRVPFRTFFDQWIYGRGNPVYTAQVVSIQPENDSFTVQVKIDQIQKGNNIADVFVTPLTLRFHDNYSKAIHDVTFINNQRSQTVTARVPFLPRNVILDEDDNIICKKRDSSVIVSVLEETVPNIGTLSVSITPNPVQTSSTPVVHYRVAKQGMVTIVLHNQIGQVVQTLHNGVMPEGTFQVNAQLQHLPVGIYFMEIRNGENSFFEKMLITD